MAWYSGLFGGGEEEQQQAAPQKGFFARMFGGIGDFIGSLVKMAVIAVAAITGLGLIFRNDSARNAIDKFTGGEGKGAGTWISNMFEGGLKKTKEFFGVKSDEDPPLASDVFNIKEIDGKKVLVARDDTLEKAKKAAETVSKNSDGFKDQQNLPEQRKEISSWNPMLTEDEKAAKAKTLNENQGIILAGGKFVESLNMGANSSDIIAAGRPSKIPLDIKPLPAELNKIGIDMYGDANWKLLSPVTQLGELHKYFNASVNANKAPDFTKVSLDNGGFADGMLIKSQKNPMQWGLSDFSPLAVHTAFRKWIADGLEAKMFDVSYEVKLKRTIFRNLDQGNLEEALKLSKTGQEYFKGESKDIDLSVDPDKFKRYSSVNKDFRDIIAYLELAQKQQKFDNFMSEANKTILQAVVAAPAVIEAHQQKIAGLEHALAGQTPPASSITPSAETPASSADNRQPNRNSGTPVATEDSSNPQRKNSSGTPQKQSSNHGNGNAQNDHSDAGERAERARTQADAQKLVKAPETTLTPELTRVAEAMAKANGYEDHRQPVSQLPITIQKRDKGPTIQ